MILRQDRLPKPAAGANSSMRPSGSRRTAKTDGKAASIRDVYHDTRSDNEANEFLARYAEHAWLCGRIDQ